MVIQLLCNTYNEIDVTCIFILVFRERGNEAEWRTHAPYLPLFSSSSGCIHLLCYITLIQHPPNTMRSCLAIVTARAVVHVWEHAKGRSTERMRMGCSKQLCPLVRLSISVSHAISKPVTRAHTAFRIAAQRVDWLAIWWDENLESG